MPQLLETMVHPDRRFSRRGVMATALGVVSSAVAIACGSSEEKKISRPERIEYYKNHLPKLAEILSSYLLLPGDTGYKDKLINRLRDNFDVDILENVKIIPLPARDNGSPQGVHYQIFPFDYPKTDRNILPSITVYQFIGEGEIDTLTLTIFLSEDGKIRPVSKLHPMSTIQTARVPDYVPWSSDQMKLIGKNLFIESEGLQQEDWVEEKQYVLKPEGGFMYKKTGEKRALKVKGIVVESMSVYENGKAEYRVNTPKKR